jgi:adenine phosphoribosyltransferase
VEATVKLVEKLNARIVGCCFLIELDFLKGRDRLKGYRVESLVHYAGE